MSIDDLPLEIRSWIRSVPVEQREKVTNELFKKVDEETLDEIEENDKVTPDHEIPTAALSWLKRREGRAKFTRGNLEEKANLVGQHFNALNSSDSTPSSKYLNYVERIRTAHGNDSADDLFDNTAKLIASSGDFVESGGYLLSGSRNGIVIGSIQSGKSASFIGLSAAALDLHSRVVLVLSGMTNKLRNQTQARLEKDLVAHYPDQLLSPTTAADLTRYREGDEASERTWSHLKALCRAHLLADDGNAIILAIKKNLAPLAGARELLSYLDHNDLLGDQPILIIDDECDHASVNSLSELWDGTPRMKASEIHKEIVRIRTEFKSLFWGYTGTPQANCLMASDDALAPHSAHVLESHRHYLGPWPVFVTHKSRIVDPCIVTDFPLPAKGADAIKVLKDMKQPPESLVMAMLNHALSGAIHRLQPRSFQPHGMRHAMMVHIIRDLLGQDEVLRLVTKAKEEVIKLLASDADNTDSRVLSAIRRFRKNRQHFRTEHAALPSMDEIVTNALHVLQRSEIRLLNSQSADELDYEDDDTPDNLVLIGGDVLARGLTIEGLRTTYFLRQPTTPIIDSALQQARWFGPHKGDQDLISIHMRPDLVERFERIAWADAQLRDELRYLTETGQPVANARIRHHPGYHPVGRARRRNGALYHSAGDRIIMNQPMIGTDGRATKALSVSLEHLSLKQTPRVLSTKAKQGQVKTRGIMYDLTIQEFLDFWKQQVTSRADLNKHKDVVKRLSALFKHLGEDAPSVHLVLRNGSMSPMMAELPSSLQKMGLRRVKRKASGGTKIDQLVSGKNRDDSIYTSDWFIDGFVPSTPTAFNRGWRTSHDPVLCVLYVVDDYPESKGKLRGEGPWIGHTFHFAHTGPAGAVTMNVHNTRRGEEE
jgi:hypothetical protein